MSTININTATKEELMGIRDIGEARANLIIKARKIKGTLTLEDLKMIEGVPNTIWDPLIRNGTVEVSTEEETPEKQPTAQGDTSALIEQYKTKLLIAEQDKVHSKREYTKELEDLKVTFEKQLWRKSAEIEECLAELQQTKDNFQREVEKDQLEREKSQKELSFENTQIKQEMSELQHQYESTMAEKEGGFSEQMESMQRERQTLMDKVMEQAQEMDKERERSKEQYKQMKQRDAEYGRKLTALEEQLQHFKTSRLISEKLAPGDIFRGKVTEMSASSWYSDSAKLKSRQTFSPDKLGDSKEEVNNNGKTPTSGKGKDDSSCKDVKSNQRSGPTPPKLAIFDGKSEWKPYFMQFNHIARKYEWSNEQKLDRLIECLRDKALKFVSTRQETVQKDYDVLVQKLSQRFGNKDLPHTIRRQLQEVRQFVDESIEEFAERIQELATDGYLNTPENVVDTIAVDAFLKGCTDKKAALFAMEKDPNTMDQALQYVKSSIHNQKILLGYRKPEVKRVQFYDDSDEESTECLVRQVKTANNSSMQDLQKKYETMETRMATTEQHIWTIKSDIKKIINSISPKTTADRQRSPSPRGRSPTRDIRDIQCYTCREMGHYSTQCPKKSWSPMRRNRSPSPNNNLREGTLNEQGLKIGLRELKPEVLGKKQVTISDSSAVHCNLTDFNSGQKEDTKNGIDNPQLREVQLYPSDRNPESNTLVLGISINEVTVNAVIDTAAQVTLMSEEFPKKLKPPVIFKGSLMLKGAGKDNSITARYTECVTVKVGKTDTKWKIIVAKINDQVILGLDFLKHLDAVIDLTDLSITIRGEKHFINEVKSENSSFKICRITLEETLIVPPNSTVRLPVRLAEEFKNEVAIQPSKSLNGLIMPNILTKADSRVPIILNNLTDKSISLKKNRFIGTAMEICGVIDEERCDYEDRASVRSGTLFTSGF
ncbi:interaptin-like [Mytilus edulis]|uniref:interaptin-like n=1 Tax=Mytilus edulis TaxID=6550 RepID=UPI0039EFDD13